MIDKETILKQFLRIGGYARVAVLTRGTELYLEAYKIKPSLEINIIRNLFWQFCSGQLYGDEYDENMAIAWRDLNTCDEILMSVMSNTDDLVKEHQYSHLSVEKDRTFFLVYFMIHC